MPNLIFIEKGELVTTTLIVSKELKRVNKGIVRLIKEYEKDFKEFGFLGFENSKTNNGKRGRPETFYYLNEQQLTFLIMMLRVKQDETDKVLKFKKIITKEFFKMRKALLQVELNKQNKEWLESREKGKETRKKVAKEYENYLKYAIENGSKTYEKKPQLAYSQFTNMVNKSLFDFEFKPKAGTTRNYMTKDQLDIVNSAEILTQKIIQQEIDKGTEYHEIFKITKAKIKTYAELSGKSKIIDILVNNQIDMLNLLK